MIPSPIRILATFSVLTIPVLSASAQHELLRIPLGDPFTKAGDVNGDGRSDLIAGLPAQGRAMVFSSVDGSVLYDLFGPGDEFGASVSGAGDIDLDGFADFIVGAPAGNYARVFSGVDGSVLRTLTGGVGTRFGTRVGHVGDVDDDGKPDVAVSAPLFRFELSSSRLDIISGATGSSLFIFTGDIFGNEVNGPMVGFGDLNGDGRGEFGILTSTTFDGFLSLRSGATGSQLFQVDADAWDETGDIDQDGINDLIYGFVSSAGLWHGTAKVLSGADRHLLHSFDGDDFSEFLGRSVAGLGDATGDGIGDFLVGSLEGATVFSGATGNLVYKVAADVPAYATSCSGPGDVNGDGIADLFVVSPGTAVLLAGNDLWLNAEPKVVSAGDLITISVSERTAGERVALFVVGVDGTPLFLLVTVAQLGPDGRWQVTVPVPGGFSGEVVLRSFSEFGAISDDEVVTIQ